MSSYGFTSTSKRITEEQWEKLMDEFKQLREYAIKKAEYEARFIHYHVTVEDESDESCTVIMKSKLHGEKSKETIYIRIYISTTLYGTFITIYPRHEGFPDWQREIFRHEFKSGDASIDIHNISERPEESRKKACDAIDTITTLNSRLEDQGRNMMEWFRGLNAHPGVVLDNLPRYGVFGRDRS